MFMVRWATESFALSRFRCIPNAAMDPWLGQDLGFLSVGRWMGVA